MSFNYYERVGVGDAIVKSESNGALTRWIVTGFVLHLGDLFMELTNGDNEIILVKGKHVYKDMEVENG